MESIINDKGGAVRPGPDEFKTTAGTTTSAHPEIRGEQFAELMKDVQEQLSRVAHVADPEIARLRVKVEQGIATAKGRSVRRIAPVRRRTICDQSREACRRDTCGGAQTPVLEHYGCILSSDRRGLRVAPT